MADEITPSDIVDAALSPQSTTIDGNTVTARPIADLVEAKQQAELASAVNTRTSRGIRFNKLVPPGAGT